MSPGIDTGSVHRSRALWVRALAVVLLFTGVAAYYLLGLNRSLTFTALREHRLSLVGLIGAHPVRSALLFATAYAAVVALSVPGGAVLTVAGGFLFGALLGTAIVVASATVGAVGLFLIAQTALGGALRGRAADAIEHMASGFRRDAFGYLLALRLVPLFPFWLVNLVPAVLGVPLRTYALATLIGIIPGTLVYATVGAGLGRVFDESREVSLSALTPQILVGLVGLALLSLAPAAYRRWSGRRRDR
jgi:uncharacterized membrane protein YdjX (TVP38/TMEM64 family)